ncbi:hypothetical protein XI06_39990 [Bradyrhizobium sp. CCBAU 11434]|nr:hypothetical protein [Bradyrhizobium sp. CCBAU 11434]
MVSDQLPEPGRIVEFELDGERHDAIGHAFSAAQAREVFSAVTSVRCSRCASAASWSRENMR